MAGRGFALSNGAARFRANRFAINEPGLSNRDVERETSKTGRTDGSAQGNISVGARLARADDRPKKGQLTMRIERRYTKDGQSPYAEIDFRLTTSEITQSRRLGGVPARQCRGAGFLVAGRLRRSGAEIFPQGRRAGAPEEGRGEFRPLLPVALGRRRGGARATARRRTHGRRAFRQAGVRPPRRHLDLLGLEGRLFRQRGRRAGLLRRAALHAGDADGARRTRRNGSTPACTGPTASTARARATTTSISRPAS